MILAIRANPERDVRPGDAVEVTVEGTPGGTATASIAGDEGAIALREDPQSPGTYRGRVTAPAGEGVYLVSARIATEAAGETTLNGPQIHVAPAPVPVVTEIAEQPPEVPGTPPASGAPGRTAAAADRPAADAGRDFVPARPVKPFEQAPAAIDPAAITRSLGLAHFDLDRHNLTDAAGAALTASVILLEQKRVLVQPDLWLLVEGHCDELGSDAYNDHLGMLRAEAARGLLVSEGLPSEKIQTVSYGRRCPLERVGGMSELNRRVQLRVVSQAEAPGAIDPGACPAN
jgi:peptidoglycan-associated lipoprotein